MQPLMFKKSPNPSPDGARGICSEVPKKKANNMYFTSYISSLKKYFCISVAAASSFFVGQNCHTYAQTASLTPTASAQQAVTLTTSNVTTSGNKLSVDITINNISGTWIFLAQDLTYGSTTPALLPTIAYLLGPGGTITLKNITFDSKSYLLFNATSPMGVPFNISDPKSNALFGAFTIDLMTRGLLTFPFPPNAFDQVVDSSGVIDPFLDQIVASLGSVEQLVVDLKEHADSQQIVCDVSAIALESKNIESLVSQLLAKYLPADQVKTFFEKSDNYLGDVVDLINLPQKYKLVDSLVNSTFAAPLLSWNRLDVTYPSPSPCTITAVAQIVNGAPKIIIRTLTKSDPGTTYSIYRNSTFLAQFGGVEFDNITVTSGMTYSYFVRSTNGTGQYIDSNTVTVIAPNPVAQPVTIAPAAPVGLTAFPSNWSSMNRFTLSWTNPTHACNISKVFYKFGSSSTVTSVPLPPGNQLSIALPQQQGMVTVYVWLQDEQGNVNPANCASVTLGVDTQAPVIYVTSNPPVTSLSSAISLSGSISDDLSGVAALSWSNDLGGSGFASLVKSSDGLSATWTINSLGLTSGVNHISLAATDIAGNTSHQTISVIYSDGVAGSGSVIVSISPASVRAVGAQWRFADEALWHNSGASATSPIGIRTINLSPVNGWTAPADVNVSVATGSITNIAVSYTVPPSSQPPYQPGSPYPSSGACNVPRDSVTLSWLGGSPNGTVTYAVAVDTNPNPSLSTAPIAAGYGGTNGSSFNILATLQSATMYYWRVYTKDCYGNVSTGPVWNFTTQYAISNLVPRNLSIDGTISPNSTVTANVTITNVGNFTAQGAYVNFYLSKTPGAKETQLNAPQSIYLTSALAPGQSITVTPSIILKNLPKGQSYLDVWIDRSEWEPSAESDYTNKTTSLPLNYIDVSPPVVSYFAPQSTFAKTGATMVFVCQATDDDAVATLDFYYSLDGGVTWTPIQEGYVPATSPAYGITYSWTLPNSLPVGANLLVRVVANDPSGNSGQAITGPYLIHDGTAPVVNIIYPNGGQVLPAGSTQQFRYAISAPNGIGEATLSLWYNNTNVTTQDITSNTTGSYSWSLPTTVTSNIAKIQISVTDKNGNETEAWSASPFSIADVSQPPPAPWQSATTVTSAGTGDPAGVPRIVADKSGILHLVYGLAHDQAAHTISFRYRKRNGSVWSSPSAVSFDVSAADAQTGSAYQIGAWSLAVDGNGYPHVAWSTNYNFISEQNKNDVFYSYFNGNAWSTPQNLSSGLRGPITADSLTWLQKTNIPNVSYDPMAAAGVGSMLYYFYYDQVYQYNPSNNTWTTKTSAPSVAVDDGGAAVANGLIYVAGNAIDGNIRIYNPSSNSWSTGAAMPSAQQGVRLAAVNGKIYAIGGGAGYTGGTKNRVYDPGANSWSTLADMPTARSHPAVAAVGSQIYVIGGYNQQQSMDIYDTSNNSWTTRNYPFAANIPSSFGGFACVVNNKIYFVPGIFGGLSPASHDVWQYDPATQGWSRMLSTQFGHGFGCGAAIGSKFYVLGGVDGSSEIATMEEATVTTDFCGTASALPCIAIDGSNCAHVVWEDGAYWQADGSTVFSMAFSGTQNVYEAVKTSGTWSVPKQLTGGGSNRHALTADQAGNLHMAYQDYNCTINYSKAAGGTWTSPSVVFNCTGFCYGIDLAVDSAPAVHVLFSYYDSSNNINILSHAVQSGSSWGSPELVSEIQTGVPPRLFVDSLRRPHAIWEGNSGSSAVWYSTKNGNAWIAPIQLNRASELPVSGSVDAAMILASNELDVVWQCANSGNPNVLTCSASVGSPVDIYPPSVVVTSPTTGTTLAIGAPLNITWTAKDNVGVASVDLDYSINDGATWASIAAAQSNTGSYSWPVPNASSILIRITARDADGNVGVGFSANVPTAETTPPSISILSPTGSLIAGTSVNIQWIATDNVGITGVDLEYSTDNAHSWHTISSNMTNSESYPWTVPLTVSSAFFIRGTAHNGAGITSSALSPALTVTTPNQAPLAPSKTFPLVSGSNVTVNTPVLQWSDSDPNGSPLTYQIRFGTTSTPPIVASGLSFTRYAPGVLAYNTTYYWQVIASDGQASTSSPIMSFTTQKQTFASWQELHFSSAELSMDSVSSMIAAPANDRISNLMKYALGLNPLIACSGTTVGMPLMGTTTTGSNRYLSLKFSGTAPDISYNVQASSDLSTWTTIQSWTPGFPPGTQTVSDTVPISSTSKRFIRLQVIGP